MPFGDGTGPWGMGPMTGRAAGYCAGYPVPGYMNPVPGRGWWWFGRGRGRGWRHWYYATGLPGWVRAAYGMPAFGGWVNPWVYPYMSGPSAQDEAEILKEQAEFLKQQLEDIQGRISEIEKAQKE